MKAYFDLHNGAFVSFRLAALQEAAKQWIGTPFAAHSCVKGAGVDCVNLAAALYIETRLLERFDPPAYSLDGGQHNPLSQVTAWLENHSRFISVWHRHGPTDYSPMAGDALCFLNARSEHHVGVMLSGGYFVHAVNRRKVTFAKLADPIYKQSLSAVFRPVEAIA